MKWIFSIKSHSSVITMKTTQASILFVLCFYFHFRKKSQRNCCLLRIRSWFWTHKYSVARSYWWQFGIISEKATSLVSGNMFAQSEVGSRSPNIRCSCVLSLKPFLSIIVLSCSFSVLCQNILSNVQCFSLFLVFSFTVLKPTFRLLKDFVYHFVLKN